MTVRAWAPDALLTARYYDSGMLRYPMTLVIEDGASLWWQLDTRNWRDGFAEQTLVTAESPLGQAGSVLGARDLPRDHSRRWGRRPPQLPHPFGGRIRGGGDDRLCR